MWDYLLMVVGFALVIKGAGLLVDGASSLARRLKVSDLVVGLTVVAFGTSLPELSVNIVASIRGSVGIAIGNILGSNIANIFLILGIAALILPLSVTRGTVWKEIPLSLLAVVMLGILTNDRLIDGASSSVLTRIDGLTLLCFFIIFLCYSVSIARRVEGIDEHLPKGRSGVIRICGLIGVGLITLIIGSRWIVDGAVRLASALGVGESLVGLTVVAVGTSLPELATSAVAAYKKNPEIAVGNVVGSNIFNIFFILGLSSILRPLAFEARDNIDIGVAFLAGLLLFLFMFTGGRRKLDRWEAALFIVLYAAYICAIVTHGMPLPAICSP